MYEQRNKERERNRHIEKEKEMEKTLKKEEGERFKRKVSAFVSSHAMTRLFLQPMTQQKKDGGGREENVYMEKM